MYLSQLIRILLWLCDKLIEINNQSLDVVQNYMFQNPMGTEWVYWPCVPRRLIKPLLTYIVSYLGHYPTIQPDLISIYFLLIIPHFIRSISLGHFFVIGWSPGFNQLNSLHKSVAGNGPSIDWIKHPAECLLSVDYHITSWPTTRCSDIKYGANCTPIPHLSPHLANDDKLNINWRRNVY